MGDSALPVSILFRKTLSRVGEPPAVAVAADAPWRSIEHIRFTFAMQEDGSLNRVFSIPCCSRYVNFAIK